jgi:hypothetical protein
VGLAFSTLFCVLTWITGAATFANCSFMPEEVVIELFLLRRLKYGLYFLSIFRLGIGHIFGGNLR